MLNLVRGAFPTCAVERTSLLESWSVSQSVKGEVDRLSLGGQPVALHDCGAGFVVDIDVCACHTPIIHTDKWATFCRRRSRK